MVGELRRQCGERRVAQLQRRGVRADKAAGERIEGGDAGLPAVVVDAEQSPVGKDEGLGLERADLAAVEGLDVLPEQHAVEGVAPLDNRGSVLLGRERILPLADGQPGVDPPAVGAVVVLKPRPGDPAQRVGHPHGGVARDLVAVAAVKEVRPAVHPRRHGLGQNLPLIRPADICLAADGHQDAEDLDVADDLSTGGIDDKDVGHVVRQREDRRLSPRGGGHGDQVGLGALGRPEADAPGGRLVAGQHQHQSSSAAGQVERELGVIGPHHQRQAVGRRVLAPCLRKPRRLRAQRPGQGNRQNVYNRKDPDL